MTTPIDEKTTFVTIDQVVESLRWSLESMLRAVTQTGHDPVRSLEAGLAAMMDPGWSPACFAAMQTAQEHAASRMESGAMSIRELVLLEPEKAPGLDEPKALPLPAWINDEDLATFQRVAPSPVSMRWAMIYYISQTLAGVKKGATTVERSLSELAGEGNHIITFMALSVALVVGHVMADGRVPSLPHNRGMLARLLERHRAHDAERKE